MAAAAVTAVVTTAAVAAVTAAAVAAVTTVTATAVTTVTATAVAAVTAAAVAASAASAVAVAAVRRVGAERRVGEECASERAAVVAAVGSPHHHGACRIRTSQKSMSSGRGWTAIGNERKGAGVANRKKCAGVHVA